MCGLAALLVYGKDVSGVNRQELQLITNSMAARGPDDFGLWVSQDKKVGFGHRRLSILDLSKMAAQPMTITSRNGGSQKYHIVYNGEIYNFRELREGLVQDGVNFTTQSDTEVILRLYERYGDKMLGRLRGMFAIAIWDTKERELFLARDPYGIKPLYYSDDGNVFRVASQVKALLSGGEIDTSPNPAGHVGFFLFGSVPEPHTFYKNICSIPSGHWMRVNSFGIRSLNRYFDFADKLLNANSSSENHTLREVIKDSVNHHLVSDVHVGLFLSGGVDSAVLAGLVAENKGLGLKTITLGFNEFKGSSRDEVPLAEEVALQYGTDHYTKYISQNEFDEEYENILTKMDQPTIDGVNTYLISRVAKHEGLKVVISGLGGDELFGGYDTFKQVPKLAENISIIPSYEIIGKILRVLFYPLVKNFFSPKLAGLVELGGSFGGAYLLRRGLYMPWELDKLMDPEIAREGLKQLTPVKYLNDSCASIKEPLRKVSLLETIFYMRNQLLRDSDWAGMAHSLEIRLPLVDRVLFEVLAPALLRNSSTLKESFAKVPYPAIPQALLNRKKTGFFTPLEQWVYNRSNSDERGLRGWAKTVYASASKSLK